PTTANPESSACTTQVAVACWGLVTSKVTCVVASSMTWKPMLVPVAEARLSYAAQANQATAASTTTPTTTATAMRVRPVRAGPYRPGGRAGRTSDDTIGPPTAAWPGPGRGRGLKRTPGRIVPQVGMLV